MLSSGGESGHACIGPEFRGKFFSFKYVVSCGFFIDILYQIENMFRLFLVCFFIMKGRWVLSNAFFASVEMIMWFCFQFLV